MGPDSVIRQQLPRPVRNSTQEEPLRLEGFKILPQNYFYHCIVELSFSSLRKDLPGYPSQGSRQKS
jgi:hypothetical protein